MGQTGTVPPMWLSLSQWFVSRARGHSERLAGQGKQGLISHPAVQQHRAARVVYDAAQPELVLPPSRTSRREGVFVPAFPDALLQNEPASHRRQEKPACSGRRVGAGGLLPLLVNCTAWVIRPAGEAHACQTNARVSSRFQDRLWTSPGSVSIPHAATPSLRGGVHLPVEVVIRQARLTTWSSAAGKSAAMGYG